MSYKRKFSTDTAPILLRLLMERPRTAYELIQETNIGHDGVHLFCHALHREGIVHIAAWCVLGYLFVPIYAFGPGTDSTEKLTTNDYAVLELLSKTHSPMTTNELRDRLSIHESTLRKRLHALKDSGYITRIKVSQPNASYGWIRNHSVAVSNRRAVAGYDALNTRPTYRQKIQVPQQSWFSSIA
jgi:predicted transcriptional regulator